MSEGGTPLPSLRDLACNSFSSIHLRVLWMAKCGGLKELTHKYVQTKDLRVVLDWVTTLFRSVPDLRVAIWEDITGRFVGLDDCIVPKRNWQHESRVAEDFIQNGIFCATITRD
jgi:hypothetical protein